MNKEDEKALKIAANLKKAGSISDPESILAELRVLGYNISKERLYRWFQEQ